MVNAIKNLLVYNSVKISSLLIAMSIFLCLVTGCAIWTNPDSGKANVPAAPINMPPVKIVIFQDKTYSTSQTRTEQISLDDIKPLIELLYQNGGELAFGLVRDSSNQPLVRLNIPVPPAPPIAPSTQGNPFDVVKKKAAYKNALAQYEEQRRQWQNDVDLQIKTFMSELKLLTDQKADANHTDIWGAVLRADLFLAESDASWPQATHRYAIFISDGEDNVRAPYVPMKSGAKVILVNGSASLGSLERLNPIRFESVRAAFQWVVASEKGGK